MSKRPTDHLEPAAKKRGSERQLTKDDASDEDEVRFQFNMQLNSESNSVRGQGHTALNPIEHNAEKEA